MVASVLERFFTPNVLQSIDGAVLQMSKAGLRSAQHRRMILLECSPDPSRPEAGCA